MSDVAQGSIKLAPVLTQWEVQSLDGPGQRGGFIPEVWDTILSRDPWMRNVVMVIDLVFGGIGATFRVRIATQPVNSVARNGDGSTHDVLPLLIEEPEIVQEYSLGEGTSSARSITLTLDGRVVDAPRLLERGGILAGFAEVSLEQTPRRPGQASDYDRRYVLIRGDVTGVRFGAGTGAPGRQDRTELVELEVVDPKETIGTKLPPWVLSTERNGTVLHPTGQGERYPIVVNGYTTIPAIRMTSTVTGQNQFAFVHGNVDVWSVDLVWVNGVVRSAIDPVYGWVAESRSDLFGEPYAVIRFTVLTTVWEDSDAVHVSITSDEDERTVIQALRDVLEEYSPLGTLGVNQALFATAESRMRVSSGVEVLVNAAGGGNAGTALEWAESGYLAQFPMISMVWENGGYGPVVTDRRLPPVAHWVVGRGPLLDRDTLVSESPKDALKNEWVLRYDYDPLLDTYRKVILRGPDTSAICAFSQTLVGERHAEPMDAPYIVDDGLAAYVLDWCVDHLALPSYVVDYVGTPDVLIRYRRGDRVDLTDDELGWSQVPATVEAIRYQRGRATVTLRVWIGYLTDFGPSSKSVTGV